MPDPIRAGDPLMPLPSEVLGSVDGGRGIAGFVLRPADLDALPVLYTDGTEPAIDAVVAPDDEDRFAPEVLDELRRLGDTFGPLGVAIAAASLTDAQALTAAIRDGHTGEGANVAGLYATIDDLRRQLAVARATIRSDAEATEEQADALRAEVARLSAYGTEQYERAEQLRDERDEARRLFADAGRRLDEQRSLAAARAGTADNFRRAAQATTDQAGVPLPAPDPLGDRRPRLDRWPDDAVTLTYPELRCLVALHLDRYCEPGSGRAMREGDVPLRLSEVLDR